MENAAVMFNFLHQIAAPMYKIWTENQKNEKKEQFVAEPRTDGKIIALFQQPALTREHV